MVDTKVQEATAKAVIKQYLGGFYSQIEDRLKEISFKSVIGKSSHFDFEKKIVYINCEFIDDVNHYVHELFHAISTNYLSDKINIGFNKKSFKKIKDDLFLENSYGYAINEGATHSLTRDATKERFGKITPIASYDFSANIYKNLENVVGKNVMNVLYLHSGTREFISTIANACHTDESNVLKLVLNLDAYFDVFRVFQVFLNDGNNADSKKLLTNAYSYLAKILEDKAEFEGKQFDLFQNISSENLEGDELLMFADVLKNAQQIEVKDNSTAKLFEKSSKFLIENQFNSNLDNLDFLPDELKEGEFYNFLLLNNYLCDKDRSRKVFADEDLKKSLTEKIFAKKFCAFNLDENLPQNIATILATRYAVRANTVASDFYMQKCLGNKKFDQYLKNSDKDYYEMLCEANNIQK